MRREFIEEVLAQIPSFFPEIKEVGSLFEDENLIDLIDAGEREQIMIEIQRADYTLLERYGPDINLILRAYIYRTDLTAQYFSPRVRAIIESFLLKLLAKKVDHSILGQRFLGDRFFLHAA